MGLYFFVSRFKRHSSSVFYGRSVVQKTRNVVFKVSATSDLG